MRLLSLKSCVKIAALSVLKGKADGNRCGKRAKSSRQRASLLLRILTLLSPLMLFAATQSAIVAQTPALAAPADLSASVSAEGITLSWTAPDGEVDGYEILRQLPAQGETELSTLVDDTDSSDASYTDTSATTPGERYVYQVKTIRGDERSDASDSVTVDFVSISCEIMLGDNHDILHCELSAGELAITSVTWTPSFEAQYEQTTDRTTANWVIADEYCGQSTTVTAAAQLGESELPELETEITLECSPEPTDDLAVSCVNLVENDEHILSCALSGGDQTITSAVWLPYFQAAYETTKEGDQATERPGSLRTRIIAARPRRWMWICNLARRVFRRFRRPSRSTASSEWMTIAAWRTRSAPPMATRKLKRAATATAMMIASLAAIRMAAPFRPTLATTSFC